MKKADTSLRNLVAYLIFGIVVCGWFAVAAANGWRAPNFGILDGSSSSGRSHGGAWGGGK